MFTLKINKPKGKADRHQASRVWVASVFLYMYAGEMEILTKVCTKCGKRKPLDEYWNHPTGKYGKRPRCIECVSAENDEHLQKRLSVEPSYNTDRVRNWGLQGNNKRRTNLATRYGITLEDYDSLLEKQNELCPICGFALDDGHRLAVDHSHKTGAIRGIVHLRCNIAIGIFKDSPEICRKAAEYLEKVSG